MTTGMSEPCAVGISRTQTLLWRLEILLILGSSIGLDKKPYHVAFIFIYVCIVAQAYEVLRNGCW